MSNASRKNRTNIEARRDLAGWIVFGPAQDGQLPGSLALQVLLLIRPALRALRISFETQTALRLVSDTSMVQQS